MLTHKHELFSARFTRNGTDAERRGDLVEVEEAIKNGNDLNSFVYTTNFKLLGGGGVPQADTYDLYTENLSVEKYIPPSIHIQDATVAGIPGCTITIQLITPTQFAVYAQDPTGKLLYASVPNDSWGTRHFQLIMYICSLSVDDHEDDTTALVEYSVSGEFRDFLVKYPESKMYTSTRTGKINTYEEGILHITHHGLLWIGKEGRVSPITGRKIPLQKIFVPFIQSKNGYTLESEEHPEATFIGNKPVTLYWLSFSTKTVKGRKIRVAFDKQSLCLAYKGTIHKYAKQWQLTEKAVGNNVLYATQFYNGNDTTIQQVNNETESTIQHLSDDIESIRIIPRTRPREARWLLCFQVLPYPFNTDRPMECAILIDSRHVSVSRNLIDWLKAAEISDSYGPSRRARKYGVDFIPDSETSRCMNMSCESEFTWRNRRHHCCVCGGIFCGTCVKKQLIKIDSAKTPKKKYVCDRCETTVSASKLDDVQKDTDTDTIDVTKRVKKYNLNASGNTGLWTLPIDHCINSNNYKSFEHILQGITYELNTEPNFKKCEVAKHILGELTDTLVKLAYPNRGDAAIRTIKRAYSRMKHYGRYDEGQKTLYPDTLSADAAGMMFQVDYRTEAKIHCIPETCLTFNEYFDATNFDCYNNLLRNLDKLRDSLPETTIRRAYRSLADKKKAVDDKKKAVSEIQKYRLCFDEKLFNTNLKAAKDELQAAEAELKGDDDLTVSITYTDRPTTPLRLNIPDVTKADVTTQDTEPDKQITFNPLRPLATETIEVFPFVILSILSDATRGPPEWLLETIEEFIFTDEEREQKAKAKRLYDSQKKNRSSDSWMQTMYNIMRSPSKQGGTRTRALTLHTRPRTYQKRAPPAHNTTQRAKTQRQRRVPCASLSSPPHTKRRYKSHPRKRTRTSTGRHHATTTKAATGHRRRAGGTRRGGARPHGGRRRSRGR